MVVVDVVAVRVIVAAVDDEAGAVTVVVVEVVDLYVTDDAAPPNALGAAAAEVVRWYAARAALDGAAKPILAKIAATSSGADVGAAGTDEEEATATAGARTDVAVSVAEAIGVEPLSFWESCRDNDTEASMCRETCACG